MNSVSTAAQKACAEIGIIFKEVPADGCFHYLDVEDKRPHNGAGRIRLFVDEEGGLVWNHVTGEQRLFWAKDGKNLSLADLARRKLRAEKEREESEQIIEEERRKASLITYDVISHTSEANAAILYLLAKKVKPTETLREIQRETLIGLIGYRPRCKGDYLVGEKILVAPVGDGQGWTTVEMIDEAGNKVALKNGRKKGCYWSTDHPLPDGDGAGLRIGIGEGIATVLSYQMATKGLGIAALSCNNLKQVAENIRARYPKANIVILSDIGNGEKQALEAAICTDSRLLVPVLPEGSNGTDINDVHCEMGLREAREQINAAKKVSPAEVTVDKAEETKSEIDLMVDELNKTCFVSMDGNKTSVYMEQRDETGRRSELRRISFVDFKNYYSNKFVNTDPRRREPWGKVWLNHPNRRQYHGIVFEPGKDKPGYYNLWQGFSVQPLAGTWKKMNDHILNIICSGDAAVYSYIIGWLATAVQKPGEPAGVALVLRGKQGTGKGVFGNHLCKLFGIHGRRIDNPRHLTGNFNNHLRDLVFLFADESFCTGDKTGESVLKGLITEPTLCIEGKGLDASYVKNMLHIVMASNNDWVVPAGPEERRFCVLDMSDACMQNSTYFAKLTEEMDNGGLEAMLFDLLDYDLTGFEIRKVPQTRGLLEQKLQSMDPLQQWWLDKLTERELLPGHGWDEVPSHSLYNNYIEQLKTRSIGCRQSATQFGMAIKKLVPFGGPTKKYRTIHGGKQVNHYYFPPVERCREYFESLVGAKHDWPTAT